MIPISEHMGIQVVNYTGSSLTISAPLANNINHQLTAFGGSLFSLCALAGWGLIHLKLTELGLDGNTVIAGGEVEYATAVDDTLACHCSLPQNWNEFIERLQVKGKASILLSSTIEHGGHAAMSFQGTYVIRLNS